MGLQYWTKAAMGVAAAYFLGSTMMELMDEEHHFVQGPGDNAHKRRADRVRSSHNWFDKHYFLNKDGLAIFWRSWLPQPVAQPAVKGIVVLSHGLAEYSMRYEDLGNKLAAKGYAVYALDHQGHGQSEGTRHYMKHFIDLVHDVHQLTEMAKKEHPGVKKVFLMAHSMGSLIAIHAVHEAPRLYDGVVLSAPPLKIDVPAVLDVVGPTLSAYLPKLPGPPLDITTLCRDESVVDRYMMDPLIGQGPIRFRLLYELVTAARAVPTFSADFPIPYLLLHGTADTLCLPEGSKEFYAATKTQDKTYKTYEGHFHELFNEPENEKYATKDAIEWLDERC